MLKAIYVSGHTALQWDASQVARIQPFDHKELRTGMRKLVAKQCDDEHGIVAEMLKSGSDNNAIDKFVSSRLAPYDFQDVAQDRRFI